MTFFFQGCLELFNQGEKLVYKFKNPGSSSKIKGADNEEKIVYSIIEKAGNEGVWAKDLRNASGLVQTTLSKILKKLVNEKIIKTVKCVNVSKPSFVYFLVIMWVCLNSIKFLHLFLISLQAPRKVVYMLYGLEPDSSVTGGAWYNDQDFESEFVDVLNQYCFHFLRQKKELVKNCKEGPIAAQNMASASSADVWKYISELGISKVE